MANKQTRMQEILQLLNKKQSDTVKNISLALGVSEMTVRRDISYLEQAGYLQTFHGGVSLVKAQKEGVSDFRYTPYLFNKADKERLTEKKRIAEFAASFIEPFDAIGVDNGTTCRYVLDNLQDDTKCIIYTYSMEVLSKAVNLSSTNVVGLFCFGGLYHRTIKMFESMDELEIIKKAHIDKLFLGAVGVSATYGLSCAQRYEVDVRQALMSVSDTIILLADSSKIDKSWYLQYGVLDDVDILITDNKITDRQLNTLEGAGPKVYVV